jgi:hypothetical protein
MKNLNNIDKTSENAEKELRISDVISSLTLEDITKIVNAFTDINITIEAIKEEIELNYL